MLRKATKLSTAILSLSILLGALASPTTGFAAAASATATQAKKSGDFTQAIAERNSKGQLVIHWKTNADLGPAKVYWSTSPDNIEKNGKLLAATYTRYGGHVAVDPKPGARIYFLIKGGNGATITASERHVDLEGAANFRDLGGYTTTDGRTVKWGKLFRADAIGRLTDADQKKLQSMGLTTDVDYRTDAEVKSLPDPVINGVNYVRTDEGNPGSNTDFGTILASGLMKDKESAVQMMIQGNKSMVDNPKFYVQLMALLNDPANMALVQHCTAGKDRTGLGSAIILLTLGVDEKTVMSDYLLSNVYNAANNQKSIDALKTQVQDNNVIEAVTALMGVQKEFLQASLDEMKAKYGSIDKFIEDGLGVSKQERAKLKAMYTE
ncbi:tyrosine-protein phosphatase [Cohnella sp. GCM10020058]|uniref:tyrosine-protein phosphatase n=1 Tax=Cohnella sp. GCM10020058 TaxID=3317330 RepID=UPI00362B025E